MFFKPIPGLDAFEYYGKAYATKDMPQLAAALDLRNGGHCMDIKSKKYPPNTQMIIDLCKRYEPEIKAVIDRHNLSDEFGDRFTPSQIIVNYGRYRSEQIPSMDNEKAKKLAR